MKTIQTLQGAVMALLLVGLTLSAISCDRSNPSTHGGPSTPFQVGQVWSYRTRPGESGSQLVICAIEYDSKTQSRLVHVSIVNLKMRNPASPSGLSDTVFHAPFTEAALRASVIEVVALAKSLPPWQQGYAQWHAAYESGHGGVWNISVADAVATMEASYLHGPASAPTTAESGLQLFGASTQPSAEPAAPPATLPEQRL